MKTLPKYPYLKNIVSYCCETQDLKVRPGSPSYRDWLLQFGFKVPVDDHLEFPDDFDEKELMLFILRWS